MLRRWVSIVLMLRNSSAAISGLVRRSTTSRATSASRWVSVSTPLPSSLPGPRAAVHGLAEPAQLALGLLPVADGAAGVELLGGALELGRPRARDRPARAERAAGERARAGGLHARADLSAAAAAASARSAGGGRRIALGRARRPLPRGAPLRWRAGSPSSAATAAARSAAARSASAGRPTASQQRVSSSK